MGLLSIVNLIEGLVKLPEDAIDRMRVWVAENTILFSLMDTLVLRDRESFFKKEPVIPWPTIRRFYRSLLPGHDIGTVRSAWWHAARIKEDWMYIKQSDIPYSIGENDWVRLYVVMFRSQIGTTASGEYRHGVPRMPYSPSDPQSKIPVLGTVNIKWPKYVLPYYERGTDEKVLAEKLEQAVETSVSILRHEVTHAIEYHYLRMVSRGYSHGKRDPHNKVVPASSIKGDPPLDSGEAYRLRTVEYEAYIQSAVTDLVRAKVKPDTLGEVIRGIRPLESLKGRIYLPTYLWMKTLRDRAPEAYKNAMRKIATELGRQGYL